MKVEKGVITNRQLMFLIFSFMEFMVMSINFVYSVSGRDTWIAVLAAYAVAIIAAVMYTAIIEKFPGEDLVRINDIVLGPYIGKLFSVLYIWFFFEYMIHFAYFFNSFWITYIMTDTPREVFAIMLIIICAMAVRSGIEVIARCSFLFSTIVAAMVIIAAILLIKDLNINNFMPILNIEPKKFIQSVHSILTIPFCDIVVFLMLMPYAKDKKKIRKPMLAAISLSTLLLLINVLVNIAVAGQRVVTSSSVTFAIIREIEIGEVLTRLDVLVAITLLITVFMKITIFYYATVLGLSQMLRLRSYKPLIVPVGIIATAISIFLYPSDMEQVYAAQYIWPFNASLFEFVLPAITLAVIGIRGFIKNRIGNGVYE